MAGDLPRKQNIFHASAGADVVHDEVALRRLVPDVGDDADVIDAAAQIPRHDVAGQEGIGASGGRDLLCLCARSKFADSARGDDRCSCRCRANPTSSDTQRSCLSCLRELLFANRCSPCETRARSRLNKRQFQSARRRSGNRTFGKKDRSWSSSPTCSIAPSIISLRFGELFAGRARTSVCCSGGLSGVIVCGRPAAGHRRRPG